MLHTVDSWENRGSAAGLRGTFLGLFQGDDFIEILLGVVVLKLESIHQNHQEHLLKSQTARFCFEVF